MTNKEKWQATLCMRDTGRLMFWPRINQAWVNRHGGMFAEMDLTDFYSWAGIDSHLIIFVPFKEKRSKTRTEEKSDGYEKVFTYATEKGCATRIDRYDPGSQSWHPVKFPIEDLESLKIMIDWYDDIEIDVSKEDLEDFNQAYEDAGDVQVSTGAAKSPLMWFIMWLAGMQNAFWILAEHRQETEELFTKIHSANLKRLDFILENTQIDSVYLVEDTSTNMLSPDLFRSYCLPYINTYIDKILEAGKFPLIHMCGLLKDLLGEINRYHGGAFEAFTTPPVGDATIREAREACPHLPIMGGTNASLWLDGPNAVIRALEEDLDGVKDKRGLIIGSGGGMPPKTPPRTLKAVCAWVKDQSRG